MSHVDEGALHAYLDGALDEYPATEADRIRAHLDTCFECAGRLEEERRVRGDAHAILALAAPEVDLPGLEELRAYVERTRRVRSPAAARLWRIGWAASVVLALGTGWLVRGQTGPGARMTAPLPEASAFVELGGTAPDVAEPAAGVEAPAGLGADAPTEPAVRGPAESRVVQALPTKASGPGVAENDATASTVATAAPGPAPAVMATTDVVLPAPADRMATQSLDVVASAEVVALPVAPVAGAGAGAAAAGEVMLADAAVTASREEPSRARSASPVAMTSAMERAEATVRRPVTEDDAIDRSVPSLVVPGLEVVSVTNLGLGTTASGVHVVQRLATGVLVEIWHLEPEVDRDVLPARPGGVEEVAERTEAGWIVIRGATTADELSGLLASLRSAGG